MTSRGERDYEFSNAARASTDVAQVPEVLPPPLLIALPGGFYVSGVVTWAVRLVNALAHRGGICGLLIHEQRPGYAPIDPRLDPRVRAFPIRGDIEACNGDSWAFVPQYAAAARELHAASGKRGGALILSPNLQGDCYGIAAALTQELQGLIRVVGWCHLDSAYDRRVLAHYSGILSAQVGVSSTIAKQLRCNSVGGSPVHEIGYGIPEPTYSRKHRAQTHPDGAPLRILYCGRLDEGVKRVSSVVAMSDALVRMGVQHELRIVGDGPAAAAISAAAGVRPRVHLLAAISHDQIGALYSDADIFVLPSKAEGLSLAMLEAMAHGCLPIVTRIRSGASQAIEHGISGLLIEADENEPSQSVGEKFAAAVATVAAWTPAERERASALARAAAAAYSMDAHVGRVLEVMQTAANSPARVWPANKPVAFSGLGNGGVPHDAPARMATALESLRGERILIHGTGRHTLELRDVIESFARSGGTIAGFCDDDPTKAGSQLWGFPVYLPPGPPHASIVVVSSWIHEEEILARAGAYQGKPVVGLYSHAAASLAGAL